MEAFDSWLLHRVAQAVEAGEVSADLLTELLAELKAARDLPKEEGDTLAVQDLAERLSLPVDHAEKMLGALEAQPTVPRHLLVRRLVGAGLAGHRKPYGAQGTAREPDGVQ